MFGAHPMFRIGGAAGYQIPYSLRFRASNSANLSRTFGTPTDGKKFTLSWWMKRGTLTNAVSVLCGINVTSTFCMQFSTQTTNASGDFFRVLNPNAGTTYLYTDTAIFRDPSAWYHFVFVFDSANATAGDRAILYVNGTRLSATVSVTLNATTRWNESGATGRIGRAYDGFLDVRDYYDGHMAEFHSIDGQALTPSSFGQTDATTGVWVPKQYAGTYGSNGFYLKFNDATTTTTIGNDSSGNANNWTTSGISVTSGVTFDQMLDTPTLNYTVWNFLDKASTVTLSDANLKASGTTINSLCRSSIAMPLSGKWYMEFVPDANGLDDIIGVATAVASMGEHLGFNASGWGFQPNLSSSVYKYNGSGTGTVVTGTAFSSNDVGMLAVDVDNSKLWLGRNGTWYESGNPATGANAQFTNLSTTLQLFFAITPGRSGSGETTANFGQRAFAYTPPTGFKALSTQNVTSTSVTVSGSFTGNASADGPFIWANGNPATLTINGNAVTFGTDADKTAGGFKLRTSSASYNAAGTNNWTATAGKRFVQARKPNNAQVNP